MYVLLWILEIVKDFGAGMAAGTGHWINSVVGF